MNKVYFSLVKLFSALCLLSLSTFAHAANTSRSGLDPSKFETTIDGKLTKLYILANSRGMEVCITNYGGRVVSIVVPDRKGNDCDVVLGFSSIQGYLNVSSDLGAAIGRYANRIARARFHIDGLEYLLSANNNGNTLHGGKDGWQNRVYEMVAVEKNSLCLQIDSPDGDQGFPGRVLAKVTYIVTEDNTLEIKYEATSDKATPINMTNHSYFNLSGNPENTILDNYLYLNASLYTPADEELIPTGEFCDVSGTAMDFRVPKAVGRDIENKETQLINGRGYDHNWILNTGGDRGIVAASLYSPVSGIELSVFTNEPGIQVYTGNFLDGSFHGKRGIDYKFRTAICLETQHFPDSPNHPSWPTSILRPGASYTSYCAYKFGIRK